MTPRQWLVAAVRDRDTQIAWGIGLFSVILLAVTADQGFVRDEGFYFRAARDYHGWFESLWRDPTNAFADATLRRHFGYNTEHPGLVKIFMGWTHKIFHQWFGWVSSSTGYRLGSIILVSVGNGFLYALGVRWFSRTVGLLAVALLLASPHVFYHAHLACFDGPIMGLTLAVVYAFYRGLESRGWMWGAGIAFGVALASKHNAAFFPATLGLAWIVAELRHFKWERPAHVRAPGIPASFLTMAVVGPVIFYIFYPYGWHDPLVRIGEYYNYHLHHEHYTVDYFGELLVQPPFPMHFPFVMSALTIPAPILIAGVFGLGALFVRGVRALGRGETPWIETLMVTNALVPPAIIALPTVPIFGGTKHWMTMMPFVCLAAAWVLWEGATYAARWGKWAPAALVAVFVTLPLIETARTHPDGQTYFNELAGGHQGGAALGMARTFWGGDGWSVLETLNARAKKGAGIFSDRMNFDDFRAYQRDGLLRQDLRWIQDIRRADFAIINHQREYVQNEYDAWTAARTRKPVQVYAFDGVPITSLYQIID